MGKEKARTRMMELTQKRAQRKAEKLKRKADAEKKKAEEKAEAEKKKAEEAEKKKDQEGDEAADEDKKEEPKEDAKEEAKEDAEMDSEEEKEEVEEDEPCPKVELSAKEQRDLFSGKGALEIKDLHQNVLSASYLKFSVPREDEGFDSIEFAWKPKTPAEDHLKSWILHRKLTVRVDDINPGDWFQKKLQEWQVS